VLENTDMPRTVADQLADTLVAARVRRAYGIVGDSLNGLGDPIRRQGKIEWLHVPPPSAADALGQVDLVVRESRSTLSSGRTAL
jgi:hypothetical protein